MKLEDKIKDVISKKLENGSVEKLIEEHLEKGISNVLYGLFSTYGDASKAMEQQIKSVMIPYLENYDYSRYITKMDSVMVEILKNTTIDNKKILENFKELMLPETRESIKTSELFEVWSNYVAKNIDTDGLDVDCCDGEPTYECVDIALRVNYDEERDWNLFDYATLVLECEHDEEMNFAIRLNRYNNGLDEWTISCESMKNISSLRRLNEFEILLMRLSQAGTKLIMDTDNENDEITPEKEPEASFN